MRFAQMTVAVAAVLMLPFFGCNCEGTGSLHRQQPDIAVSPNPLEFDAPPQVMLSKLLHVQNTGDYRLEIQNITIESGADAFSLVGDRSFQIVPSSSRDLEVHFVGEAMDVEGTLVIQSNVPQKAETSVALIGKRRQGPIMTVCVESADIPLSRSCSAPSTIDFGSVAIGETRTASITLGNEGTDTLMVSSVSLMGAPSLTIAAPSAPLMIAVGEHKTFPVRFNPSVAEQDQGTITIQSNDVIAPSTQVALSAEGVERGLCVEPAALDFGIVKVGGSKDLSLKLKSCGSAPIELSDAEILSGSPPFSLISGIPNTISLPVGATLEIQVHYAPTVEGSDSGQLRINSSNGRATVPLTGEGSLACRIVAAPDLVTLAWSLGAGAPPGNILIENAGAESCTVTRVEITSGADKGFAFLVTPFGNVAYDRDVPQILPSGQSMTAQVLFAPQGFDHSMVSGQVQIEAQERPHEVTTVNLEATLTFNSLCSSVTVSPDLLSFGVVSLGQRRSLITTARSMGGPCMLSSIALTDDANGAFKLAADNPDIANPTADLVVEFKPSRTGDHRGNLRIVTSLMQTFDVPLIGTGGTSELCVMPRDLPFGQGTTRATMDFNVTACGPDPVTVSGLSWIVPDSEFSITSTPTMPFTLSPGDTRAITVQYSPRDALGHTGVLAVRSTDAVFSQIDVRATSGPDLVPPASGRFLYYWQIATYGNIMRQPLQGNLTPEPFWGPRVGKACSGCHQISPDGRFVAVTNLLAGNVRSVTFVDVEANATVGPQHDVANGVFLSWKPDVNTTPPYQYVYSDGDLHIASLFDGYIGPVMGASDPTIVETMPSWGPDGQIAFVAGAGVPGSGMVPGTISLKGPTSIYLINEAGGVAVPLSGASNNGFANYYPRYSPNALWIAYTLSESAISTFAATDAQIRLVKADSSGQVLALPLLNAGASSFPTWSRGGDFLSFSSDRPGGVGSWDLYISPIDPVTGQERAPFPLTSANTPDFEHAAQWSP
jgi:hypothetical protein